MPYGLDVVENLGRVVLPELNQRLRQELTTCSVDQVAFQDLLGNTAVGGVISTLSATTDKAVVESLATLKEADNLHRAELERALREGDPKVKAQALRRMAKRLTTVLDRINLAVTAVGDAALETLKSLDEATQIAIAAQELAARRFQAGEALLACTGGKEWQVLFEAARRFSAVAYPGKELSCGRAKCAMPTLPAETNRWRFAASAIRGVYQKGHRSGRRKENEGA